MRFWGFQDWMQLLQFVCMCSLCVCVCESIDLVSKIGGDDVHLYLKRFLPSFSLKIAH